MRVEVRNPDLHHEEGFLVNEHNVGVVFLEHYNAHEEQTRDILQYSTKHVVPDTSEIKIYSSQVCESSAYALQIRSL